MQGVIFLIFLAIFYFFFCFWVLYFFLIFEFFKKIYFDSIYWRNGQNDRLHVRLPSSPAKSMARPVMSCTKSSARPVELNPSLAKFWRTACTIRNMDSIIKMTAAHIQNVFFFSEESTSCCISRNLAWSSSASRSRLSTLSKSSFKASMRKVSLDFGSHAHGSNEMSIELKSRKSFASIDISMWCRAADLHKKFSVANFFGTPSIS